MAGKEKNNKINLLQSPFFLIPIAQGKTMSALCLPEEDIENGAKS